MFLSNSWLKIWLLKFGVFIHTRQSHLELFAQYFVHILLNFVVFYVIDFVLHSMTWKRLLIQLCFLIDTIMVLYITNGLKFFYLFFYLKERFDHRPEDDHQERIVALASCVKMKLVASAGAEGTIKIWNMDCKLIRYAVKIWKMLFVYTFF